MSRRGPIAAIAVLAVVAFASCAGERHVRVDANEFRRQLATIGSLEANTFLGVDRDRAYLARWHPGSSLAQGIDVLSTSLDGLTPEERADALAGRGMFARR